MCLSSASAKLIWYLFIMYLHSEGWEQIFFWLQQYIFYGLSRSTDALTLISANFKPK